MPCEEFHTFKSFPSSKREEIIQEGIELLQRRGKPNLSAVKRFLNEIIHLDAWNTRDVFMIRACSIAQKWPEVATFAEVDVAKANMPMLS
jgi:hypothetical protein